MFKFYSKIFSTGRMVIHLNSLSCGEGVEVVGKKIDEKIIKLFQGSLAIREVDTGSDNSCEQELTALSNPYYDVERFGIHFVASPRPVSYTHLRAHETRHDLVCRLLLEK